MLQMRRRDTAERLWALRLRFSNGQIDSEADRYFFGLERFRAKWTPVRVKKTRQNKRLEPRF
jgi:hypothetical protein